MRSFRDRNPYAVGIVSMLLIGAITGLAFMVGLLHLLEDTYAMQGSFTDAAGLRSGDDVKLAGVKVGRVTGHLATDRRGSRQVEWVINTGVDISEDAGADIALETLLGSKFIRITDATEGDELMADLPDPRRAGRSPSSARPRPWTCSTSPATPRVRIEATDNERAQPARQRSWPTSPRASGPPSPTSSTASTSWPPPSTSGRSSSTRSSPRPTSWSPTWPRRTRRWSQLIDSSRTILDFLVQRRDELTAALGAGSDAVRSLSVLIDTNAAELDAILDDLHPTLATVDANLPDLNRALAFAGPAFYGQSLAGTHGPWQDIYIASLGPDIIGLLEGVLP